MEDLIEEAGRVGDNVDYGRTSRTVIRCAQEPTDRAEIAGALAPQSDGLIGWLATTGYPTGDGEQIVTLTVETAEALRDELNTVLAVYGR